MYALIVAAVAAVAAVQVVVVTGLASTAIWAGVTISTSVGFFLEPRVDPVRKCPKLGPVGVLDYEHRPDRHNVFAFLLHQIALGVGNELQLHHDDGIDLRTFADF